MLGLKGYYPQTNVTHNVSQVQTPLQYSPTLENGGIWQNVGNLSGNVTNTTTSVTQQKGTIPPNAPAATTNVVQTGQVISPQNVNITGINVADGKVNVQANGTDSSGNPFTSTYTEPQSGNSGFYRIAPQE